MLRVTRDGRSRFANSSIGARTELEADAHGADGRPPELLWLTAKSDREWVEDPEAPERSFGGPGTSGTGVDACCL